MTILGSLLRSAENPAKPLTDASLIDMLGAGFRTDSSIYVSEKSAVKFIAVYRAVALVAGAIASLPLAAFHEGKDRRPFTAPILGKPHIDSTSMETWETTLAQELLWGNAYVQKIRNRADQVVEVEPIPPNRVRTKRIERSRRNPWGKLFRVTDDNGSEKELTPFEIMHIPGPSLDGLTGLSPIGVARQAIGLGLAAETYGARLFGEGTLASGVLETEQELNEEQAKRLKKRWREKVAGLAHAHEPIVLDKGAKYHALGLPPEDAQFIQTRAFQIEEIARLYGIPPHLLAKVEKSTSWGTGIEQQQIALVVYTLTPWISRFEQRISAELLPPGVMAEFRVDRLMRGDAKSRYAAHALAIQNGIRNRNQVRVSEGEPPVAGGDLFLIPANMTILGEDGLPLAIGTPDNTPGVGLPAVNDLVEGEPSDAQED